MIKKDLHVHTYYCDGKDSPRDIVLAAVEMGMETLGFSGHGYADCDVDYCMSREDTEKYKQEITALKKEFSGKLEILCGVEKEIFSIEDTSDFDYVIGSAHCIFVGGEYIAVDWKPEELKRAADKYFGGDMLSLAKKYYETVSEVAEKTNCDIVGHIDLITKFNEGNQLFDTKSERYIRAWKKAVDRIMESCKLFEVNTGAISRGYRTSPYPSDDIVDYIKKKGGKLILSSDSHSKDTLCYKFGEYEDRYSLLLK